MADPAFDRLACVCNMIMDQRVIDLRKENEELKLQVYWRDYNVLSLRDILNSAHVYAPGASTCKCMPCCVSGFSSEVADANPDVECAIAKWFKGMAERHGLTVEPLHSDSKYVQHPSSPVSVYDQDCHIVRLRVGDFSYYSFGARIWKARTVANSELRKLEALFMEIQLTMPLPSI